MWPGELVTYNWTLGTTWATDLSFVALYGLSEFLNGRKTPTSTVFLFLYVLKVLYLFQHGIRLIGDNYKFILISLTKNFIFFQQMKQVSTNNTDIYILGCKGLDEKESHQIYWEMKSKRWKIGEKMYYLIETRTRLCVYKIRGIGS